jgi:hypothetical protein
MPLSRLLSRHIARDSNQLQHWLLLQANAAAAVARHQQGQQPVAGLAAIAGQCRGGCRGTAADAAGPAAVAAAVATLWLLSHHGNGRCTCRHRGCRR